MSNFSRKQDIRVPYQVIRIYTEGTKTEPNYFNSIRDELRINEIEINVNGCGDHTLPLIDLVIQRKNAENKDDNLKTEWWAVFDKDEHSDFNKSIELAKKNDIQVAYSNECFELWFILHFEYLNTAIGRNFQSKLTKLLGVKYEKGNLDVYSLIKDKENTAIRFAKNLEKMHDLSGVTSAEKRDPSTTIYKLVERLRLLKSEKKTN